MTVNTIAALLLPQLWGVGLAALTLGSRYNRYLVAGTVFSMFAIAWSFAAVFVERADVAFALASGIYSAHLLGLAIVDARLSQVPDVLTVPFIASGLAHAAVIDVFVVHMLTAIFVAGLVVGLAWIMKRVLGGKTVVGVGDVLLLAGVAAWLGPIGSADAIILSFLLALLGMVVLRRGRIPFAPFLAIAGWCTWILGPVTSSFVLAFTQLG